MDLGRWKVFVYLGASLVSQCLSLPAPPQPSHQVNNQTAVQQNLHAVSLPRLNLTRQSNLDGCLKDPLTRQLWTKMGMDQHLQKYPGGMNLSLSVRNLFPLSLAFMHQFVFSLSSTVKPGIDLLV
jgi:hypothetical protein